MLNEKVIATAGVVAVAVIMAFAAGVRWVLTGDIDPQMLTILATLAGVLLGVPISNGLVRKVNGRNNQGG